jgi:hypothetical protein
MIRFIAMMFIIFPLIGMATLFLRAFMGKKTVLSAGHGASSSLKTVSTTSCSVCGMYVAKGARQCLRSGCPC